MERGLFALQRLSAMAMAPFVLVHLGLILYAARTDLTAQDILARTRGSWGWIAFYTLFVLSLSIHVPIGLRCILIEWTHLGRRAASVLCLVFALALLFMGLRAVVALGGLAA